ncbi:hypothetical protein PAL_GLEAN10012212 [Pteropus alecto]|uniref:Uncharacterized protein n=1 Tax=Pteropus alecto TaxID=9402 RepID=L5KEN4_PTEAL|nr:hypothetical protein PAL_GLEAN10012212 [Pteropus alecto]
MCYRCLEVSSQSLEETRDCVICVTLLVPISRQPSREADTGGPHILQTEKVRPRQKRFLDQHVGRKSPRRATYSELDHTDANMEVQKSTYEPPLQWSSYQMPTPNTSPVI